MTALKRRLCATLAMTALAAALTLVPAAGAATSIDSAFGSAGFVTPSVFPHVKTLQNARGVALQSDGRIVVPMTLPTTYGHRDRRPVIRLNADGTRDKTYGHSGVAWVRGGGAQYISLLGAKTMPGDATLVWGEYKFAELGPPNGFFVTKVSATGSPDKTFGGHGARRFVLDKPGTEGELTDVSPAADGGVIVTVNSYSEKRRRNTLRVTRLSPDGSTDQAFGDHGTGSISLAKEQDVFPGDVSVAGFLYVTLGHGRGCAIRRYGLSGSVSLDTTYGTNGSAFIGAGATGHEECVGVSAEADGHVNVFGAHFEPLSGPTGNVHRLGADGLPVPGFGVAGVASVPSLESVSRLLELPGGGVIASGGCSSEREFDGCLTALDATGASVASFGRAGTLNLGKYARANVLVAQGSSVAALIVDEDSKYPLAVTKILKLTN